MKLYQLKTLSGELLFETDSPDESRTFICDYLDTHPDKRIIEQDNRRHPTSAFPFTAWRKVFTEYRGSMHPSFNEAVIQKG